MRIRQHVNPLKLEFLMPRGELVLAPPGRDVEVELGCAEAQFLFERVAQDPRRYAVGLEIRRELVDGVNRRALEQAAPVQAIFCHMNIDLPGMFAPGSVARMFVNFPDPWFKRRHHKRRVLDEALVTACARALRPGGELFFQSDVWELALEALAALEEEARLENSAGAWTFWRGGNPYGVRSRREQACAEEGLPVWRLLYRAIRLMAGPTRFRESYDRVAEAYAQRFLDELAHKPLDRAILEGFVELVRGGRILDVGCGPGQTTRYLHGVGARVIGLDVSSGLIAEARAAHPRIPFLLGDMFDPPFRDEAFGGLVAFYAVCHAPVEDLDALFSGWRRILAPGGWILVSFHVGEERVHLDEWLDQRVDLDFWFFPRPTIEARLKSAGMVLQGFIERDPDPKVEYPSRRAYVLARKGPVSAPPVPATRAP